MSPKAAWAVLSDTDRFNRAAGLGYRFEENVVDGVVVRVGRMTRFGQEYVFDEAPWTWSAPRFFRVERKFRSGPAARVEVRVEFEPLGSGTSVRYAVDIHARNALAWPVVRLDAMMFTRPALDSALMAAFANMAKESSVFDDSPPKLDPMATARVDAMVGKLTPRPFGDGLRDVILNGPLTVQDRIRPLEQAELWGVTEAAAVNGCLQAVRDGLLTLRWELLCPSCGGPKQSLETLPKGSVEVHCPSCNIAYDGTFPEQVDVVFRPTPNIRRFVAPVDCISSPSRTPHVVAQAALGAGRELTMDVDLQPGPYRVHLRGLGQSTLVNVTPDVDVDGAVIIVDPDGVRPGQVRVRPGNVSITVRSRCKETVLVVVEERWQRPYALTAGRLLADGTARGLLQPTALWADATVEILREAVLAVVGTDASKEATERLRDRVAASLPIRLRAANGCVVATWERFDDALSTAAALVGADVALGLDLGTVVAIGSDPTGTTVSAALASAREAGMGRVGIARERLEEPDIKLALQGKPIGGGATAIVVLRYHGPPDGPEPTQIGPWKLVGVLGEGGFGKVYDAVDAAGQQAAIKVLAAEMAGEAGVVQRFHNEARLVSRLLCPHTVRVFDYGQTRDGRLYIVMEKLVARPLDDRLNEGPLTPTEAVGVASAVLLALEEAHAAGIVHRDVKPGNILLGPGFVKLIDFGVASRHGEQDVRARLMGTPRYMSPEHLEVGVPDTRSDVYSVGLVLYEALCGVLPWDGISETAAVYRRLKEPPRPIGGVPPELGVAVMRSIDKDASRRYATARQMREALLAAM